jgi:plastocyanin
MRPMKGARAVAGSMLILIAVCLVPAVSAAQDTTAPTTTTTTQDDTVASPSPEGPPSAGAAAGTPPEAAGTISVETAHVGRVEPADVPGGGPTAKASASASVSIGDNFFSPASVSIAVGDTVNWSNNGQAQHSATADDGSFDTGVFGPGASRSHTFTRAGTFSYYCTVHGQAQSGTVRVLAASGGGSGGGGGPTTSATGDSEAAAVASPDAAGTSTTLPATGMAAGVLALVGLALVASGSLVGRAGGTRDRQSRFLTIF